MSAASFGGGEAVGVTVGAAVGDADGGTAVALADGGALVAGTATAVASVGVGEPAITASCVERRPAAASPTASAATSTNGKSVNAVLMRRTSRRYGFLTVTTV
jgi:hypothetical protein